MTKYNDKSVLDANGVEIRVNDRVTRSDPRNRAIYKEPGTVVGFSTNDRVRIRFGLFIYSLPSCSVIVKPSYVISRAAD